MDDPLAPHYDYPDSQLLHLRIQQSSLPFSGEGLFATVPMQPHQIILQYYGSIIPSSLSMAPQFTRQDKMVQIDQQYSVVSRSPASKANDIVKWEPNNYHSSLFTLLRNKQKIPLHPGKHYNARISVQGKQKAFLRTTEAIQPGQEIFIDYGFEYWDFFYKLHLNCQTQQAI